MELIRATNPLVIYILCGILFNVLYDLMINYLGEESENLRLTDIERFFVMLIWPLPLLKIIYALLNPNKND